MNSRSSGVLVAVGLAVAVASGCASNDGGSTSDAPSTPSVATTSVASTPVSESPSPTAAPSTAAGQDAAGDFIMPNEVGKVLQTAQDDIQEVSGNPIFFTHSVDATGRGRHQILDRDWQVCGQNIKAGKRVTQDVDITFSVVKTTETCP